MYTSGQQKCHWEAGVRTLFLTLALQRHQLWLSCRVLPKTAVGDPNPLLRLPGTAIIQKVMGIKNVEEKWLLSTF